MSERRKVRLYAYMSSKGGVGKSTLSVATAWLAATAPGREVVLLDLDMWGSSLGDGLPLCAPVVPQGEDSVMRFHEPPSGQLMSRDDTLRARHRRRFAPGADGSVPSFLPYLNDALFVKADGDTLTAPIAHFLWRFDGALAELPLHVIPSSPLLDDVARVAKWMADVHLLEAWAARVWLVVTTLIAQRPALTDIVCDLPPGMVGLTMPFFSLISTLAAGQPLPDWVAALDPGCDMNVRGSFVSTPDQNAMAVTAEAFLARKGDSPGLALIVNRGQGGADEVERCLGAHFKPFFGIDPYQLHRQCELIDERRELQLFRRAARALEDLDPKAIALLRRALRVPEVER